MIMAIDPGNVFSAYCIIDDDYRPVAFGKYFNKSVLEAIQRFLEERKGNRIIIEMVASYGMPVGKEVFETCIWIGRYIQMCDTYPAYTTRITRQQVKANLCHAENARDSNVRRALIDRFAKHDLKSGKGTKKSPDWFYGFADDMWSAYAVGVTALDTDNEPAYKEQDDDVIRCSVCGKGVTSETRCPRCGSVFRG